MIKAIYVTQRMYDELHRISFGAQQTDTRTPTISGVGFNGIDIIVNDTIPDPPGIFLLRDDGVILYP